MPVPWRTRPDEHGQRCLLNDSRQVAESSRPTAPHAAIPDGHSARYLRCRARQGLGALLVRQSCCGDHGQVARGIAVVLPLLLQNGAKA